VSGTVRVSAEASAGDRDEQPGPLLPWLVLDVEAAFQRAEEPGGTRTMGPATSPGGLVVGRFTDPEGNLVGVAGAA
jgi:uncharacterized protein